MTAIFEIDEGSLPFVQTRQAVLANDLQNVFVSTGALLHVETPNDFVDKIVTLTSQCRPSKSIIWVRTVFEASRPVNSRVAGCENVITDKEVSADLRGKETTETRPRPRPSENLLKKHEKIARANGRNLEENGALLAGNEAEAEQINECFLTVESGSMPTILLPQTTGSNFIPTIQETVDLKKDLVFQKSFYSAFKDETLVQILRAKFITKIYLCGTLTNMSVFATAMDAARYGYSITIVEDCLGYRSKARHDEALRQLVEFTGCDVISSTDLYQRFTQKSKLLEPLQNKHPRPTRKESGLEGLMGRLNIKSKGSNDSDESSRRTDSKIAKDSKSLAPNEKIEDADITVKSREFEGQKPERVKSKVKIRRRPSKPSLKGSSSKEGGSKGSSSQAFRRDESGPPGPETSLLPNEGRIVPTTPTLRAASNLLEVSSTVPSTEEAKTALLVDEQLATEEPKDSPPIPENMQAIKSAG
jgi:nicotinamidase-related amidase